jgi:ribosomal protein L15E
MGAYKYLEEIWRKKQSDVVRFLLRVRYVEIMAVFMHRYEVCKTRRPMEAFLVILMCSVYVNA